MNLIWQRIISNRSIRLLFYFLWILLTVGIVLVLSFQQNIVSERLSKGGEVSTTHSTLATRGQTMIGGKKQGFISTHAELCPKLGLEKKLVVIVFTKATAKAARMTIRLTWGHFGLRRDTMIVFVTSLSNDDKVNIQVKEEDLLYGDLLIEPRKNYEFFTILHWMSKHCRNARFVLKTTENTFVNVPKILNFISLQHCTNKIFCHMGANNRMPHSKGIVRVYCSSATYLMTMDTMLHIARNATAVQGLKQVDYNILEVVDSLNVTKVHVEEFYNGIILWNACRIQKVFSIECSNFMKQFEYWVKSVNNSLNCDKQKIQMNVMKKRPKDYNLSVTRV